MSTMTLSIIKSILLIIVLVYIGFGVLLYFFQQNFIYFPSSKITDSINPRITITSDGELINLWTVNAEKSDAIIYFGGNAANAHNAIPQLSRLFNNQAIYLVDYRGYGSSSGTPSELALYTDALAIYDNLIQKHNKISVIGQSLGSGVATYLASLRDINKLVLNTPFDSIEAVAKKNYPIYPISSLLQEKFDSFSRVSTITAETLIVIAGHDRIIPKQHAYNLASGFQPDRVTVSEITNTGHNTITSHPDYETVLTGFLH